MDNFVTIDSAGEKFTLRLEHHDSLSALSDEGKSFLMKPKSLQFTHRISDHEQKNFSVYETPSRVVLETVSHVYHSPIDDTKTTRSYSYDSMEELLAAHPNEAAELAKIVDVVHDLRDAHSSRLSFAQKDIIKASGAYLTKGQGQGTDIQI